MAHSQIASMKLTTFIVSAAALAASAATAHDVHAFNGTDVVLDLRRISIVSAYRMCGVDVAAIDDLGSIPVSSAAECCYQCFEKDDPETPEYCSAASWSDYQGGTCWLKATYYRHASTTPNAGVDSFFLLRHSTKEFIWSAVKEGFDMVGNDIDTTKRKSFALCKPDCVNNSDCYSVTWTDYEGGTCWLKNRASTYVTKAGAKTAYLARPVGKDELHPTPCPGR